MIRLATLLVAAALAFAPLPAAAQPAALEAAEAAVEAAWAATPLSFRKTLFVSDATAFGVYTERADANFKPGEPIIVYAEPVGYGFNDKGDGTFSFGFNIDLMLKTKDGEIIGGQDNFAQVEFPSHSRNREFLLTLTLDLGEGPVGDYVLQYTVRDIASDKTALITMPFAIVE